MLFPEEKKTYEKQIGKTKYIVTSESLPDSRPIIDSMEQLMAKSFDSFYDPPKKSEE